MAGKTPPPPGAAFDPKAVGAGTNYVTSHQQHMAHLNHMNHTKHLEHIHNTARAAAAQLNGSTNQRAV